MESFGCQNVWWGLVRGSLSSLRRGLSRCRGVILQNLLDDSTSHVNILRSLVSNRMLENIIQFSVDRSGGEGEFRRDFAGDAPRGNSWVVVVQHKDSIDRIRPGWRTVLGHRGVWSHTGEVAV